MVIAIYIQRAYMNARRELTRITAVTKSPIISIFTEILSALPEIRAMDLESYFHNLLRKYVNENGSHYILSQGTNQWFNTRVITLNLLLVQIPIFAYLIYLCFYEELDFKTASITLIYATNTSTNAINSLKMSSEVEIACISVERCSAFEAVPHESGYTNFQAEEEKMVNLPTNEKKLNAIANQYVPSIVIQKPKLIKEGQVEFSDVSVRYSENSRRILKKISFTVKPGEKIGVVGRTGSGKSTLTKVFWRCLENCSKNGQIKIDGKEISSCDLKVLRSEMDVVNQETFTFKGTLRENLIFVNSKDIDDQLITLLQKLNFKPQIDLDMGIQDNGNNLSKGEKQILCIVRILLSKRKLIIMDEATSNLDGDSESQIKKYLLNEFDGNTMFIIAHKIQTIMHCDRIMVLKNGEVVEFDNPKDLLNNHDGEFHAIYQKLIEDGASELE